MVRVPSSNFTVYAVYLYISITSRLHRPYISRVSCAYLLSFKLNQFYQCEKLLIKCINDNYYFFNATTDRNVLDLCVNYFMFSSSLETDLYDMCQGGSHIFERGYLKTPHYPDANYTNNLNCRCRLRTADSSLLLHILDFSVNRTMQGVYSHIFHLL